MLLCKKIDSIDVLFSYNKKTNFHCLTSNQLHANALQIDTSEHPASKYKTKTFYNVSLKKPLENCSKRKSFSNRKLGRIFATQMPCKCANCVRQSAGERQ